MRSPCDFQRELCSKNSHPWTLLPPGASVFHNHIFCLGAPLLHWWGFNTWNARNIDFKTWSMTGTVKCNLSGKLKGNRQARIPGCVDMSAFGGGGGAQTNRVNRGAVLGLFVCSALGIITHKSRNYKTLITYIFNVLTKILQLSKIIREKL